MNLKNNISFPFLAGVLSILLLFPSFIEFVHTLEGHEHLACDDVTTHIHQKDLDCSLCDFQFSTFSFEVTNFEDLIVSEIFSKQQTIAKVSEKNTPFYHFLQRGPPIIS